jgi:hypothetical protein
MSRHSRQMMGVGVLVAMALCAGVSRAAMVIYQDTFDRTSAALNGDQMNVASGFTGTGGFGGGGSGATWTADSGVSVNGSVATATLDAQIAYLPFAPQAGYVYTYAIEGSAPQGWSGFGFLTPQAVGGGLHFHQHDPAPWVMLNTGGSIVWSKGPGYTAEDNVGSYTTGTFRSLAIVLDTQTDVDNWTAKLYIDSSPVGSTFTYSAASWTGNAIGFGDNGNSDVQADNLSLTVIPEPATFGFMGMAAVAMLLRRRFRR